jgi:hypothetical protein
VTVILGGVFNKSIETEKICIEPQNSNIFPKKPYFKEAMKFFDIFDGKNHPKF